MPRTPGSVAGPIERRRKLALELRLQGLTYSAIAEELRGTPGVSKTYNHSMAHTDVKDGLKVLREEMAELAAEVLDMELQRLDVMLSGVWEAAANGDAAGVSTALRIMDRRARYLGLDKAPTPEGATEQPVKQYIGIPLDEV